MKKFLLTAVTSIAIIGSATAGEIKKNTTTFHDLTSNEFRNTAYTISEEVARAGNYSQRFQLLPGACGKDRVGSDCERNAERVERIYKKHTAGKTHWYAYSMMLDSNTNWHEAMTSTIALGQVKAHDVHKPIWILKMRGGQLYASAYFAGKAHGTGGDGTTCHSLESTANIKGKWLDIVIKADYSSKKKTNHSYFQIWFNGELVCDIKDTIVNEHTWKARYRNESKDLSFRYGIYNFQTNWVMGKMPTRVVYYDEMRTGNTLESVQINKNNPVD